MSNLLFAELATAPASQHEWSEDELQYSIIVRPTSRGNDRFRITARSKRPSTLTFPFNTIGLLERNPIGGGADFPQPGSQRGLVTAGSVGLVATAVSAIAAVSLQPVTSKEIHHEELIYH